VRRSDSLKYARGTPDAIWPCDSYYASLENLGSPLPRKQFSPASLRQHTHTAAIGWITGGSSFLFCQGDPEYTFIGSLFDARQSIPERFSFFSPSA
jgi:hypothetical protein